MSDLGKEIQRMVTDRKLFDCARFACCGRSSATAAARGLPLLRGAADKSLLHDVNERNAHDSIAAKL
jgi:hypothetical protein